MPLCFLEAVKDKKAFQAKLDEIKTQMGVRNQCMQEKTQLLKYECLHRRHAELAGLPHLPSLSELDHLISGLKAEEKLHAMLGVFAEHKSKSVQHTLYAMADKVLQTIPQVEDIELRMPNLHCLLVDLSRFGQDNPNEIFVPIDEPHGYIEARLSRTGSGGRMEERNEA